ncbi:MAG: hypothetical protein GEV10_07850 [Streptosporangiales bacterium]|nr:hypothetical protein [Streptosporangiales bacterium]
MTVTQAAEAVRRYAAEVRQALSDIPEAELGELGEDLDGHLAEVGAEIGDDVPYEAMVERLGTPAEYAAELRQAAGLPAAGNAPDSRPGVGWRVAGWWWLCAQIVATLPFLGLAGLAGGAPEAVVLALILAVAAWGAALLALSIGSRRLARWSDIVATAREARRPDHGGTVPGWAVSEGVTTWWLRVLAVLTLVAFVGAGATDGIALGLAVAVWLGTAVGFAIAWGKAPWRASYTQIVKDLPDVRALRRLRDHLHDWSPGAQVLDYLASLRPAWWLARALAATVLVDQALGGGLVLDLVVFLAAAVISVWLGRRNRVYAGWNAVTVPGNLLAVAVLLALLTW